MGVWDIPEFNPYRNETNKPHNDNNSINKDNNNDNYNNVGMEFGIKKGGVLVLKRGKIAKMEGVLPPHGQVTKEIEDRECRCCCLILLLVENFCKPAHFFQTSLFFFKPGK